ncbi:MAG TPA: hypothetical protein VHW05_04190 [Phenylobacterium sp.]|jgi:hypothetical protein|nr:hypothetical protein [Phenylobacterium sp.]
MRGLDALKAVGVAVLVLALNYGVAFLAVAADAQFVEPGHPQSYYAAAAPRIAGWSAPFAGALLLAIAAFLLGARRPQRNALKFAGLIWLAYIVIDLGSGAAAGDAMLSAQMAVSMGLALAGALAGGALAKSRSRSLETPS